jgi:hypothetical protein
MDEILGALAFALLIGGQFLAAIVVTSWRKAIYADPNERLHQPIRPTDEYPKAATFRHHAIPEFALAHLEPAQHASGRAPHGSDESAAG